MTSLFIGTRVNVYNSQYIPGLIRVKDSAGTGEIGVREARGHFSSLGDEVKGSPGAAVVMAMGVDTDGFKVQSRPRDFKTWMCSEI